MNLYDIDFNSNHFQSVAKMFDSEDVLIAATAFIVICKSEKRKKKRRFWVQPRFQNRSEHSGLNLINDLILDDVNILNLENRCNSDFKNFFRITSGEFEFLLKLIGSKITKKNTNLRRAISAQEKLALTLRFFATGDSYHSLMYLSKISKQAISRFIPEVCAALIESLSGYIKMPSNGEEWQLVAADYNSKWNFPNCVGVIDEKRISLQPLVNSESRGQFSLVIFAVIDANYNFIYTDVKCQDSISDGDTSFYKMLENDQMHLPVNCCLPGRNKKSPFVFIGDDTFPMMKHLLKPYSRFQDEGSKKRIFNYRLSRARRVSDNVFGILCTMFKILQKPLLLEPEAAIKVILAIIHLHNFLRMSPSKLVYNPPGSFDSECVDTGIIIPGVWRNSSIETALKNVPKASQTNFSTVYRVRDEFCEYFSTVKGAIPWQYQIS